MRLSPAAALPDHAAPAYEREREMKYKRMRGREDES
jgi:hypothetical protein